MTQTKLFGDCSRVREKKENVLGKKQVLKITKNGKKFGQHRSNKFLNVTSKVCIRSHWGRSVIFRDTTQDKT